MHHHDLSLWTIPANEKKPISIQLEQFMIAVIRSRAVQPRESIPSHRVIAKINNINRNTALKAYTKLISMGWLVHYHGGRAVVADMIPGEFDQQALLTSHLERMPIKIPQNKHSIDDPRQQASLDFVEIGLPQIERIQRTSISRELAGSHSPHRQAGKPARRRLDEVLVPVMITRGFHIAKENFCILRGRSESLTCIFRNLCNERCILVNTSPEDSIVCGALKSCGAQVIPLRTSQSELLKTLVPILEKTQISALYIRPNSAFPTSDCLDEASRSSLVKLAVEHSFYIVEEDDDHELWWGRSPLPPLAQQQHQGHVIHCAALSRISPYMQHLRTLIAPAQFIAIIKKAPERDLGYRDTAEEQKVLSVASRNEMVSLSRQVRLTKRKHLLAANEILNLQLAKYASFELPEYGTAIWISFSKKTDLVCAVERLKGEGHPIRARYNQKDQSRNINYLRLDFSRFSDAECRKAAIALRNILSGR